MFGLFKSWWGRLQRPSAVVATKATLEKSRDRVFRSLIENAFDIISILSSDGTIVYESPSVNRTLGFAPDELVGRNAFEFVHPDDVPAVQAAFLDVIANKMTGQGIEFRFLHKDGSWRYLQLTGTNLMQDAYVEGIVVNSRDVTERRLAEQSLRESEERYALAVRGANDGLWDWDLRTNRIYLSPRWKSMLGFHDHELEDSPEEWFQRIHPEDSEHVRLAIAAHRDGTTPHFESEYRILHKDSSWCFMLSRGLAIRDENGRAFRIAGSQTDITDRKHLEEQLYYDALHDGLTGLPNRTLLLDRLEGAMARAQRRKTYRFAVMFLDLDRFKVVNDSLGHNTGDQLLIEVSHVLQKCVRPEDTVARLGGDEFIILIDDLQDPGQAATIAQRIHDRLRRPLQVNGHEAFTTASIGIAFNSPECKTPEDFLRDSDIAMYRAKSLGKARSETFDASMRARALHLLELESELRHALERNEFECWYQPIVEIATRKIIGFESLVRWHNPKRGLIPAGEFIPIAEETGLIFPLGLMTLRESCKQISCWQKEFDSELVLSANLSGRQFTQPDLVERITEILELCSFAAPQLRLEVTESVVIGNLETAERILRRFRKLGVKICLDDFGTGYSSLSYLVRLPIDILKIDRSFISGIDNEQEQSEVVHTIIELGQRLGMRIVGEGVETNDQLNRLTALGCDEAQGYFFSRPVDATLATQLLRDSRFSRLGVTQLANANAGIARTRP